MAASAISLSPHSTSSSSSSSSSSSQVVVFIISFISIANFQFHFSSCPPLAPAAASESEAALQVYKMAAATTTGGSIAVWNCSSYFRQRIRPATATLSLVNNVVSYRRFICCSAVQESSTPTVAAETKEKKVAAKEDTAAQSGPDSDADGKAPKPKAAAKTPVKALAELMEEDVIPSLKTTLEAEQDITELTLAFRDNKLEGSFVKKGIPYTFWAFFPDGSINGPKGFSISSYGGGVSTVEPFLVDEKKPTAKLFVFWVEKRLAAQGIIPVWKQEDLSSKT